MATPEITIKSAKILCQNKRSTDIRVVCQFEGADYRVLTEISEGRSLPNTSLEGYTVPPTEEFVVALHEALANYKGGESVAVEMARICNGPG